MKIVTKLYAVLPRKTMPDKKMNINLNYYRNWHYIVSNQIKDEYTKALEKQLSGLKIDGPIKLHFVLYKKTNRRTDRANILSIHEKFFCDALVHYGVISDDNDDIIQETKYSSGGVDGANPRVEIFIEKGVKDETDQGSFNL